MLFLFELNIFVDQLRKAEDNALNLKAKMRQVDQASRGKLEASITGNYEVASQALGGFDRRSAVTQAQNDRLSTDLAALYHSMRDHAIFLVQRFGTYEVKDGKLLFKDQSTADAYNALQAPFTVAATAYQNDLINARNMNAQQTTGMRGPF